MINSIEEDYIYISYDRTRKNCLSFCFESNEISMYFNGYNKIKNEGTIYCLSEKFKDVAIERIGKEKLERYLKEGV